MPQSQFPPPTVGRVELADWLNVKPSHLSNKLCVLQRDHGFPRHLPGTRGRWSRAAVLAWIDGATDATSTLSQPFANPAAPASRLEQIYGGVA